MKLRIESKSFVWQTVLAKSPDEMVSLHICCLDDAITDIDNRLEAGSFAQDTLAYIRHRWVVVCVQGGWIGGRGVSIVS